MRTILAIAAAALLAGCAIDGTTTNSTTSLPDANVIVNGGGDSHGSGINIGNGYIFTAAHVALDSKELSLELSDGTSALAEVLWVNKRYDVALMRSKANMQSAPLSCRQVSAGEAVKLVGNPADLKFVSASGTVVSKDQRWDHWPHVYVVDATVVPGMSGGGALDRNGNVIGITVGVQTYPIGLGSSLTGFGAVVPSTVLCELLVRG